MKLFKLGSLNKASYSVRNRHYSSDMDFLRKGYMTKHFIIYYAKKVSYLLSQIFNIKHKVSDTLYKIYQ